MLLQEPVVWPYQLMVVALGLGGQQQALNWLSQTATEHADAPVLLSVEPKFDPLQGNAAIYRAKAAYRFREVKLLR